MVRADVRGDVRGAGRPVSRPLRSRPGSVAAAAGVLDGLAQIKLATGLQSFSVRSDAPVTACLPWVIASAEAALAAGAATASRRWCSGTRTASPQAAAVLLELDPAGPALRLAGAEGGYRTAMLALEDLNAAALAEALLARPAGPRDALRAGPGPGRPAGPGGRADEHGAAGLGAGRLVRDAGRTAVRPRPRRRSTSLPSVRRTLRKVRNRLVTDGVDGRISFTRERRRILGLLPGMAVAYRDRDEAHGLSAWPKSRTITTRQRAGRCSPPGPGAGRPGRDGGRHPRP